MKSVVIVRDLVRMLEYAEDLESGEMINTPSSNRQGLVLNGEYHQEFGEKVVSKVNDLLSLTSIKTRLNYFQGVVSKKFEWKSTGYRISYNVGDRVMVDINSIPPAYGSKMKKIPSWKLGTIDEIRVNTFMGVHYSVHLNRSVVRNSGVLVSVIATEESMKRG